MALGSTLDRAIILQKNTGEPALTERRYSSTERLEHLAKLLKANFNPNEPRDWRGRWTAQGQSQGDNVNLAQLTISREPWEFPWRAPVIPKSPTAPIPGPFIGPYVNPREAIPQNPCPDRPEYVEEWAAAMRFCLKMEKEGKFSRGGSRFGRSLKECLMGQVSEDCGGNPTA